MLEKMSSSAGVTAAEKVWEGDPPDYMINGDHLMDAGLTPVPSFKEIITRCTDMEDSGMRLYREVVHGVIRNVINS